MRYVMDTTFVIDFLRDDPAAVTRYARAFETGDELMVNEVVVCEAATGAQGAALFVAGVVILMYAYPGWYGGFHDLAVRFHIFMPMMIAGLAGIGVFFQLSEIQEERSSQAKT